MTLTSHKLNIILPPPSLAISLFFCQGGKLLPNYPDCPEEWTNNNGNALNSQNTFYPQSTKHFKKKNSHIHVITQNLLAGDGVGGGMKCSNDVLYVQGKKLKFTKVKYF